MALTVYTYKILHYDDVIVGFSTLNTSRAYISGTYFVLLFVPCLIIAH